MAAAVAASVIATPTLAAGSSAPTTEVAPAPESVAPGSQQQIYGASILLQVGIVVVVALLIWLAIDQLGGNDKPASP